MLGFSKQGCPLERIQESWLVFRANVLCDFSVRHGVQNIKPAFGIDSHKTTHAKCIFTELNVRGKLPRPPLTDTLL